MTVRSAPRIRAALLLGFLVLTGVAVGGRAAVRMVLSRPSAEDRRCAALDPLQRIECFDRANRAATSTLDVRRRLAVYQKLVADGAMDDCHMPAHELGHHAAMSFSDPARALRAGGTRCGGGYLHGVVQGAFHAGHDRDRTARARSFCDAVKGEPGVYSGCVHGLGHALLEVTGRVDSAVTACGTLGGDMERHRCTGGVMMQNSMRFLRLPEDRYRIEAPRACGDRHDTPMSRLDSLCHTQIGEIAMMRYAHDLARATPVCEAIPFAAGRAACLSGARTEAHAVSPPQP